MLALPLQFLSEGTGFNDLLEQHNEDSKFLQISHASCNFYCLCCFRKKIFVDDRYIRYSLNQLTPLSFPSEKILNNSEFRGVIFLCVLQ